MQLCHFGAAQAGLIVLDPVISHYKRDAGGQSLFWLRATDMYECLPISGLVLFRLVRYSGHDLGFGHDLLTCIVQVSAILKASL